MCGGRHGVMKFLRLIRTRRSEMKANTTICDNALLRRRADASEECSGVGREEQKTQNQQVCAAMYGTMVSHSASAKTSRQQRRFLVQGGRSFHKRLWGYLRQTWTGIDCEFDDLEGQGGYYKPEAIETLCQLTKFNKRELQLMYRGFKQECPSGMVKEETFKGIYAQFFPRGAEVSQYAHFVFNTFDQDHTGAITFTDFVVGLSVLARGSLQEKLRWAFSLYDINGDGYITKDEVTRIVSAIYDLMGKSIEPMFDDSTTRDHVERVFQKLDLNKDGVVTIDEFMDSCTKDENITKNMSVFNTVL